MKIKDIKENTDILEEQKVLTDFEGKANDLINKLKDIDLDLYDVNSFLSSMVRTATGLQFFHERCLIQNKKPHEMVYHPKEIAQENQVVFVDLGRGFPKETFDGHWCYILRNFGVKALVIPTTSVKDNSKPNPNFEIDILIKDFGKNDCLSRLHVDDLRAIDIQRIDDRKPFYNLVTNKEYIVSEINRIALGNIVQITNIYNAAVYNEKVYYLAEE
jgi:hypothetical protein